jgi:hypothetical protein
MNALFLAPGGRVEQNHRCGRARFILEHCPFARISDERGAFSLFGNSAPANFRAAAVGARACKIAGKGRQCQPPGPNFGKGEPAPRQRE